MKIFRVAILLNLLPPSVLMAQDPAMESARAPITNEFGDPLTNCIDQNGAWQGDWYYVDIYDSAVVLKKFKDHKCIGTFYASGTTWKNSNTWENDLLRIHQIKTELSQAFEANGVDLHLNEHRQIGFIFNSSGELTRLAPMGDWEVEEAKKVQASVEAVISSITLNLSHETFLLF